MKKLVIKKINFKKSTIARIDSQKIYGGFVNPTEETDDTDCFPKTLGKDENTNDILLEPSI